MSNRLAAATSPYLRQHAGNPVDWWTWSDAALAAARSDNKPILLSIGYSACHWCHVMAHESFEDAATARVMNELFVCIKVDREERPDLDKIYQLAHQALTRRGGGWPLTVFLTPDDHLPFYAGTYFPREARYGMPPFTYVLQQVRAFWDERRDDVRAQNAALSEFLTSYGNDHPADGELSAAPIRQALAQIEHHFDSRYGGHAGAPKFPHCPEMELLLDVSAPPMVDTTLARMAAGGIHDQIGGGFCRYSVDERWEIPHFEKMLYDNAQLLAPYALLAADNSGFAFAAHGIVAWLEREMTAPGGAFYSALDADSEHEEGKFYVWKRDEVRALLDDAEFAIVERHFGFDRAPNFENTAWNPLIAQPLEDVAQEAGIAVADAHARLISARTKLFAAREKRVRPGLDDKILTAWNALMIGALAQASRARDFEHCLPLAERALEFVHANLRRDGRLLASFAGGIAALPAYLDDHAFLLDALLECLQLRWNARDLDWAIELADELLERFEDRASGGFFFTAHDHEKLIQRPKSWMDEAVPSGTGVAASALLRLGHLLGETRYLESAERALRAAYPTLTQTPQACPSLLRALNDFRSPRTHVVIRYDGAELARWRAALQPPRRCDVYCVPADASNLRGSLQAQKYTSGGVAYVCRGTNCLAPIKDPAQLAPSLRS